MNNNFRVSFLLASRSKMKKDGHIAILYRIHLGSKRMDMGTTGVSISAELWDSKVGKAKGKSREAVSINKQISDIESDLRHIFRKLEFSDTLSLERIKNIYLGDEKVDTCFLEYFDKYIEMRSEEVGHTLSAASLQKYKVTRRRFSEYLKEKYKKDDILITQICFKYIANFEHYLKTNVNMKNDTCMRMLRTLNTVIIRARREGLLKRDPFLGIHIHFDPPKHRFLTEHDIVVMLQKKFISGRLERVRDLFIFACLTGLSHADMKLLRKENIAEFEGMKWLVIPRKKTGILSSIPLLDIPLQLLAKYDGKLSDGRILPTLSNQRQNEYLKEIAVVCNINRRLTCHVARHTFATLAISKGVSLESASKMLGHANIRTTRIYAAITDEKVRREMERMSGRLDKLNDEFKKAEDDMRKRKKKDNDKSEED